VSVSATGLGTHAAVWLFFETQRVFTKWWVAASAIYGLLLLSVSKAVVLQLPSLAMAVHKEAS